MPTLTVTATTDYRFAPNNALITGKNITDINFVSPLSVQVAAIFSSTQFGGANISNSVAVTGGLGDDSISVIVASGAVFSAAAWSFSNWNGFDRLSFQGAAGAESITGTAFDDNIIGSAGADTLRGGDGDDRFYYASGDIAPGEIIDGGVGTDWIAINGSAANFDFTSATFVSIERLVYEGNNTATLTAAQANGLTEINGGSGTQTFFVNNANGIDLSDIAFINWTNGTDVIDINATTAAGDNSFIGSSQNDDIFITASGTAASTIQGGGGADTLRGANGASQTNTYNYIAPADIVAGEVITGGNLSSDVIQLQNAGTYDFRSVSIASVNRVEFEAASGATTAVFNSSQFSAAGLSLGLSSRGGGGFDTLNIKLDGLAFSANGFGIFLPGTVIELLLLEGTASSDSITGWGFANEFIGGAGADTLNGGIDVDIFTYNAQAEIAAGESITGNLSADVIRIGTAGSYDFTGLALSSIEEVDFSNAGGAASAVFNASQFGAGLANALLLRGAGGGPYTFTAQNISGTFSAAGFTFAGSFNAGDVVALSGGNLSDTITGTTGADSITGGASLDELSGGNGNDTLNGGFGLDIINAGAGFDTIIIQQGDFIDSINGGADQDTLDLSNITVAGVNADLSFGGYGIAGAGGTQAITSVEVIRGTQANDTITGSALAETLYGNGGNDTLNGGGEDDALVGGDGADRLFAGLGNDEMIGGLGDDTLVFATAAEITGDTAIEGGDGIDTIELGSAGGVFTFQAVISGVERLQFTGAIPATVHFVGALAGDAGLGLISEIIGSANENTLQITGNAINLTNVAFTSWTNGDQIRINGTAGADMLTGSGQIDVLTGGAGADTMDGGIGTDTADYSAAATIAVLHLDTPVQYGQYGSGAGGAVETDILAGIENLIGGSAGDYLYGSAGANFLQGVAGNDYIAAGDGNDTILGGADRDFIDASYDNDSVDGGNEAGAGDTIYGGAHNDTLNGGDGDDYLYGDHGADSLSGGNGVDVLFVDSTDAFYDGGAGIDYIVWQDAAVAANVNLAARSADYFYGYTGADVAFANGATARVELHGGDGNDTLIGGGPGGSILLGEGGNDRLVSEIGVDHMVGGTGADAFVFSANGGVDFVYDFSRAEGDTIDMAALGLGAGGFGALTITTTYSAGGWYGYSYGSGTAWVNTLASGAGALVSGDFIFV